MTRARRNAALGAVVGVTVLSLAASLGGTTVDQALDGVVAAVPGGDLTGHLLLMGACSFLAVRGFGPLLWRGRPLGAQRVAGMLLLLSLIDEGSQHWLAARTCSWSDAAANTIGIVTFAALAAATAPKPLRAAR